jgi:hypothetical protein
MYAGGPPATAYRPELTEACAAPRSLRVPDSIDHLASVISDLESVASALGARTAIVCRNEPSVDSPCAADPSSGVELADRVDIHAARVRAVVRCLGAILDRLEV